jgi:integrase
MPAKTLTTAAVERFKPTSKRRFIRDGGAQSLYLAIMPSGHKSWLMRFRRPDGKPGKLVLGPLDLSGRELKEDPKIGQPLSLVAARQLAAVIHRDRAMGADVISDHKARRHRLRTEIKDRADNTFGALVRKFVEEHGRIKTRRWRRDAMVLGLAYPIDGGEPVETRNGLAQRWGDKPVRSIDGHDIHAVVDEARQVAVPGIAPHNKGLSEARARSLHAALSSMFGWLKRHRLVDSNPCTTVWRPPPAPPRDRVLDADEVPRLWKACDAIHPNYAAAVRMLLLTGARLMEVARMERSELSADGAVWTLPGSRTKNHRGHVVPLPPLAREIIAQIPQIDDSRFVFSIDGRGALNGWSRTKAKLDAAMGAPPWRLHDLRRTAATGMAELGIPPHIVEAVLNHISGAKAGVAGIYNRAAYAEEKKAALERWAAHIAGLVEDRRASITPIRAKRSARAEA